LSAKRFSLTLASMFCIVSPKQVEKKIVKKHYISFAEFVVGCFFFAAVSVHGQIIRVQDSSKYPAIPPAYSRPVNAAQYLIRPGEQLTISFINSVLQPIKLIVDPECRLVNSTLGIYDLQGLTLKQVREKLLEPLRKNYSVQDIDISIGEPYAVTISVAGTVEFPGFYPGYTSNRVSDMIEMAGGISWNGSRRRILLKGGRNPIPVDLDAALYLGIDSLNPYLYAGMRIDVPPQSHDVVQVVGCVNIMRQIELMPGDDVNSLIKMAGGIKGGIDKVIIQVITETSIQIGDNVKVNPGDIIKVIPDTTTSKQMVSIFGEVMKPGQYEFEPGTNLKRLIERAGGTLADANISRAAVFRKTQPDEWNNTREGRYAIQELSSNIEIGNLPVRPDDSVIIPRKLDYVRVSGFVARPGLLPFTEGKKADYYIELAGGFLPEADRKLISLVKRVSGLSIKSAPSVLIYDGDEIMVNRLEVLQ
jgi:protein involved in polysaccharide export with SLBB domain